MRVLIVEDEEFARSALSVLLTAKGYHTSQAGSAEQALDTLEAGCRPEIALVDFDLPGMNGADFISRLVRVRPNVLPIMITASDAERLDRVLDPSVIRLQKPLDFDELLVILNDRNLSNTQH